MASEYGLEVSQLRKLIVRPALLKIDLWSESAENLVVGTALTESRGRYLHQLGKGPAVGLWQMEPATWYDILDNYLKYNVELGKKVFSLAVGQPDPDEMAGNLYFAAAMCRVHYRRVSEPLPVANDALGMAKYWCQYYNTPLGKGTVEGALPHFEAAIE